MRTEELSLSIEVPVMQGQKDFIHKNLLVRYHARSGRVLSIQDGRDVITHSIDMDALGIVRQAVKQQMKNRYGKNKN